MSTDPSGPSGGPATLPGSRSSWTASGSEATIASEPGHRPAVGVWQAGQRLGSFVVERPLGAGAMGIVLLARDAELDRHVAIKVLAPGRSGEEARQRLIREAQVTARLSHPNVVAVHQVGTLGEQIYLVMEFVDGGSLGAWARGGTKPWTAVLDAYRQAGRGLAAAHAAGLVHRDFKPDNILIGRDGRVRVTDFGLVGIQQREVDLGSLPAELSSGDTLTKTGTLLGTPAYMAPEQFRAGEIDARADQFAFCVALFEGLYGFRPFAGDNLPNLVHAVMQGQIRAVPPTQVPKWVHDVLLRGLSVDRNRRYPDMNALLAALEAPPPPSRVGLWIGLGALGLLLAGGGTGTLLALRQRNSATGTRDERRRVDDGENENTGTKSPKNTHVVCEDDPWKERWDKATAERLDRALVASGSPISADLSRLARTRFDEYVKRWDSAAEAICKADEAAAATCLDDRRAAVTALAALTIERANDPAFTSGIVGALPFALPDLERCTVSDHVPPLGEIGPELALARAELVRTRVISSALLSEEAKTRIVALLPTVRTLAHAPTLAETLLLHGDIHTAIGTFDVAEASLREAVEVAAGARDHYTEGAASIRLLTAIGSDFRRAEEAKGTADAARAAVARARSPLLEARLSTGLAVLAHTAARFDEALVEYDRAVERYTKLGGHEFELAQTLSNRAATLHGLGRLPEAEKQYLEAIALLEAELGENHPLLASAHVALGNLLVAKGDMPGAKARFETAVLLVERTHGPDSPKMAEQLLALAEVLLANGETAEARRTYERALAVHDKGKDKSPLVGATIEARLGGIDFGEGKFATARSHFERSKTLLVVVKGEQSLEVADIELQLGAVAEAGKDLEGARLHFERTIAIQETVLGPKHETVAFTAAVLGDNREGAGQCEEARRHYQRALTIRNDLGLPADASLAQILAGMAACELRDGLTSAAEDTLRPALELVGKGVIGGPLLGRVQFVAAKLRFKQGRGEEAQALASKARDAFAASGPAFAVYLAEVEAWQREPS